MVAVFEQLVKDIGSNHLLLDALGMGVAYNSPPRELGRSQVWKTAKSVDENPGASHIRTVMNT